MRKLLLTTAFCLPATTLAAQETGFISLGTIILNGLEAAGCLAQSALRGEGDLRPVCLGRGEGRGDLPGATLDQTQFDRLPTGARANSLVKRLPSVTTGGGPGEDKDARVLGLDKEYTRTVVDGLQLPDGGEKREYNLDRFPVAMVDSVEVLRAKTADMEADGIAGKIILHTKDIPAEPTRSFGLSYGQGSDGVSTYGLTAHVGGMITKDFGAQAVINIARDGGSKEKVKIAANGTRETETEIKPITSKEVLGDVLWNSGVGTFRLKPMLTWQEEDKEKSKLKFTAAGAANGSEAEEEVKDKVTRGATLSWAETFGGLEVEARAGYQRGDESKVKVKRTFNVAGALTGTTTETEAKLDTNASFEIDGRLALARPDSHLKFGIALRDKHRVKDKSTNDVLATGKDRYVLDETYAAAFVMGELTFGNLRLKPGLRYEFNRLDGFSPTSLQSASGTSHDLLPSVSATWTISDAWTVSGGVGRSVNRPKFDQLSPFATTSGSTTTIGNPDLDPQRATTFDLDVTHKARLGEFVFGLWHRDITGVIEDVSTVSGAGTTIQPQNVGDGTTTGISLTQRISLADLGHPGLRGFTIGSNQNWATSRLHVAATDTYRAFKEQPGFWGDVFVEWRNPADSLSIMAAAGYTGKITSAGDNGDETRDAELTLDLKVTHRMQNGTEFFLMGENLLQTERVKRKANGDVEREAGPSLITVGLTRKF